MPETIIWVYLIANYVKYIRNYWFPKELLKKWLHLNPFFFLIGIILHIELYVYLFAVQKTKKLNIVCIFFRISTKLHKSFQETS